MGDLYLIEKRGLYYRPHAHGYTGLKEEAGRYTLDEVALHFANFESPNQDGMTYVHESDAPEYSSACAWDVRLIHKTRQEALRERTEIQPLTWTCAGHAYVAHLLGLIYYVDPQPGRHGFWRTVKSGEVIYGGDDLLAAMQAAQDDAQERVREVLA